YRTSVSVTYLRGNELSARFHRRHALPDFWRTRGVHLPPFDASFATPRTCSFHHPSGGAPSTVPGSSHSSPGRPWTESADWGLGACSVAPAFEAAASMSVEASPVIAGPP